MTPSSWGWRTRRVDIEADAFDARNINEVVRAIPDAGRATDAELLRRCRAFDADAWASLVERYERLVFSVAMRNGLSREDASDVTQTTFLSLLRSMDVLRDDERLAAWLMTVARRQAWLVQRRNDRQVELVDTSEHGVEAEGWDRVIEVHEALRATGSPCRELLVYLYFDPSSPSYVEVADRLGRSVGTIGPMRARCLQQMRRRLDGTRP